MTDGAKAVFKAKHKELGMPVKFGELELNTRNIDKSHEIAGATAVLLEQVRNERVFYHIELDGDVIDTVNDGE